MRLLTFWVATLWVATLAAAPPEVKFPAPEMRVRPGQFVVVKAEVKNGKGDTRYKVPAGDDLSFLDSNLLADKSALVFIPMVKNGTFTFWAWSGNEDGASELAEVRVVVGDGGSTPPPVKPDDPKAPPRADDKLFFVVVGGDGPADPKASAAMRLPAWDDVRRGGHQLVYCTRTEITAFLRQAVEEDAAAYKARLDGYVGKLVVLRVSGDGKSATLSDVKPLPATDAAVKELLK